MSARLAAEDDLGGSQLKEKIEQARTVMNLILLIALIMGWAATRKEVDVERLVQRIADGPWPSSQELPEPVERYHREKSEDYPTGSEVALLDARVADLLAIRQKVLAELGGLAYVGEGESTQRELYEQNQRLVLLEELKRSSGADADATVRDLQQKLDGRDQLLLPFVKVSAAPEAGIFILACAHFFLLLYLVSLELALVESARGGGEKSRAWVFLHPGWLGFILGCLWLLSPLVALLVSLGTGRLSVGGIYVASLVAANVLLVFLCAHQAFKLRQEFDRVPPNSVTTGDQGDHGDHQGAAQLGHGCPDAAPTPSLPWGPGSRSR